MLNRHQAVDGLYWWWPEANEYGLNWATQRVTDGWYNASLWDNETGRALPALDELRLFLAEDDAIDPILNTSLESQRWHTIDGRLMAKPLLSGVYIRGNEKVVMK